MCCVAAANFTRWQLPPRGWVNTAIQLTFYQIMREERGLNCRDYAYIEHFPLGYARQFPPNVARHQQIFQVWIRPVPNETRVFAFRAALRELQNWWITG